MVIITKKEEINICRILYSELIENVSEDNDIKQASLIFDVNDEWEQVEDLCRLAILDPMPIEIDNDLYYRVSRVVRGRGITDNYNANLKERGINIFCTWNYNIDDQLYVVYFYNSCISTQYCPILANDLYYIIIDADIRDIQEDKREEFTMFRTFLKKLKTLDGRIRMFRVS